MPASLPPNTLSFIALCNEYCQALENCAESLPEDFISTMVRLLPRIYITASDLPADLLGEESYIPSSLDEDYYDAVRRNAEGILGENDTYLEVFEEDMKYSDTPIGASISEALADLYQVFYNFLVAVKDATTESIEESVGAMADDFASYWSQILVNVMRPLNSLRHNN